MPEGLPSRSLIILNVAFNKLKSLKGIEQCSNLQFLNAARNQIKSVQSLGALQNLKEVFLGQN